MVEELKIENRREYAYVQLKVWLIDIDQSSNIKVKTVLFEYSLLAHAYPDFSTCPLALGPPDGHGSFGISIGNSGARAPEATPNSVLMDFRDERRRRRNSNAHNSDIGQRTCRYPSL